VTNATAMITQHEVETAGGPLSALSHEFAVTITVFVSTAEGGPGEGMVGTRGYPNLLA